MVKALQPPAAIGKLAQPLLLLLQMPTTWEIALSPAAPLWTLLDHGEKKRRHRGKSLGPVGLVPFRDSENWDQDKSSTLRILDLSWSLRSVRICIQDSWRPIWKNIPSNSDRSLNTQFRGMEQLMCVFERCIRVASFCSKKNAGFPT